MSSSWAQLGQSLNGEAVADFSSFGYSVSSSSDGTIVAISAPFYNGNTGVVKIYQYSSSKTIEISGIAKKLQI